MKTSYEAILKHMEAYLETNGKDTQEKFKSSTDKKSSTSKKTSTYKKSSDDKKIKFHLETYFCSKFYQYKPQFMRYFSKRFAKEDTKNIYPFLERFVVKGDKLYPDFVFCKYDGNSYLQVNIYQYFIVDKKEWGEFGVNFIMKYEDEREKMRNALSSIILSKGGKYGYISKDIVKILCKMMWDNLEISFN